MPADILSNKILQKIIQLNDVHEKAGNSNRPIGVDTLCMLFDLPPDKMAFHLEYLSSHGRVRVSHRTENAQKTGKNKVTLVQLLQ